MSNKEIENYIHRMMDKELKKRAKAGSRIGGKCRDYDGSAFISDEDARAKRNRKARARYRKNKCLKLRYKKKPNCKKRGSAFIGGRKRKPRKPRSHRGNNPWVDFYVDWLHDPKNAKIINNPKYNQRDLMSLAGYDYRSM